MIPIQKALKWIQNLCLINRLSSNCQASVARSRLTNKPRLVETKTAGFTLIELLISALIAGLIVSGLLGIVVELVSTNRRGTGKVGNHA